MAEKTIGQAIAQRLLEGATKQQLMAEGFAKSTIEHWIYKLKKKGKQALLKVVDGGPVDILKDPPDRRAETPLVTASKKTYSLPKTFAIPVTVRLDWDNLYFFYRAKAGGYDGDMSDYVNDFCREGFQLRGFKLAEVYDPETAKKLSEEIKAFISQA